MSNDNEDEFQVEEPSTPSGLKAEGMMVRREAPLPVPEDMEAIEDEEELAEMEMVPIIEGFESKNLHEFGLDVGKDEDGEMFAVLVLDNVTVELELEDFCQLALGIDAALPKLLEMLGKKIQANE